MNSELKGRYMPFICGFIVYMDSPCCSYLKFYSMCVWSRRTTLRTKCSVNFLIYRKVTLYGKQPKTPREWSQREPHFTHVRTASHNASKRCWWLDTQAWLENPWWAKFTAIIITTCTMANVPDSSKAHALETHPFSRCIKPLIVLQKVAGGWIERPHRTSSRKLWHYTFLLHCLIWQMMAICMIVRYIFLFTGVSLGSLDMFIYL